MICNSCEFVKIEIEEAMEEANKILVEKVMRQFNVPCARWRK
jgi:formylmethanofuran dehydrogenase subunit B